MPQRRAGLKRCSVPRQAITHPDWNPNTFNSDITLLRLSSPAQLSSSVSPICLAPANLNLPNNLQCVTTGWGRFDPNCTSTVVPGRAVHSW